MHSSKEIIEQLEAAGWKLRRINGDDHIFKHPENPLLIMLSHPVKNLSIGQIKDAERKSGLRLIRRNRKKKNK